MFPITSKSCYYYAGFSVTLTSGFNKSLFKHSKSCSKPACYGDFKKSEVKGFVFFLVAGGGGMQEKNKKKKIKKKNN